MGGVCSSSKIQMAATMAFDKFDVDDSGEMDANEIKAAFAMVTRIIGHEIPQSAIDKAMQACDVDGDGVLDKTEFTALVVKATGKAGIQEDDIEEVHDPESDAE
eukprot:TRINITY_DN8087_c0_g1_i1.p1 TRINITY_DN8087_c0_g1~~TRINITY_DN8087_c0_g1_i1.p1  ORF type:complete len:104 (+),score=23.99 TRINITY_DN8087_c0_g1_i1:74-385(+)